MEKPSQTIRELASRLIEAEASAGTGPAVHGAELVCQKLQLSLTRFAGVDAFSALMRRALALSRAEIPALKDVKVGPEGCVEGLDLVTADGGIESGTTITANLLWLLVTFLGEPVAMRLINGVWPDSTLSELSNGD